MKDRRASRLHAATGRLALLALVEDLVVAIDATQVFQIHRTAELSTRRMENALYAIDLDKQTIPGWDLGLLFGFGPSVISWVLVDASIGGVVRRFGLQLGACVAVRPLPPCHRLSPNLFGARHGAFSAAFTASTIEELKGAPSGVVLDVGSLLQPTELDAGLRVARRS